MGGALLGHMITTIDPKMFILMLTFNILLIVVLGGNGSITGSVLAAIIVTVLMEALRFLDMPMNLLFFKTNGLAGSAHGHLLDPAHDRGPVQATGTHGQQGVLLGHVLRLRSPAAPQVRRKGRPLMLRTDSMTMRFGGLTAVADLNMEIEKNEIVGLIGPNGAGKTTAFNMITGVYAPYRGAHLLPGQGRYGLPSRTGSPNWASPAPSRTYAFSRT